MTMVDSGASVLDNLPDDVISANEGNLETHRGSDTPPVDVPNDDTAAKPVSLRDQISSALKGEATPPAAQIDGGAARNPDGTFAPKPAPDLNAADQSAPPAPSAVPYPQGLPGLDAATFAALPAETQQHVARTMEALNRQTVQYSQIEQVIAPRRQAWALNGMTEGQVLNQLFALSDFAENRPDEFVRYFASQRGLDLEDLAFGPLPEDPNITATNQRIQQLEAQISGFTAQQQQAAHTAIVDEIVQFADEKGADGKTLLRPYFAELGNEVLPFIQQAMQQNPNRPRTEILTEAYDRASWANPSVRAKMQAAADAARTADRIRASTAAAGRAASAGVSVATGVPGEGAVANGPATGGSMRDTIKAAIAAST